MSLTIDRDSAEPSETFQVLYLKMGLRYSYMLQTICFSPWNHDMWVGIVNIKDIWIDKILKDVKQTFCVIKPSYVGYMMEFSSVH